MLWIYSANDHFFSPLLAQRFYKAFTQAGGKAQFILAPPFGDDGHHLFSLAGVPTWAPMVDEFLKRQNLVLRQTLLQIPLPAAEFPSTLPDSAREEFQQYLLSAPHKALVASSTGTVSVSIGRRARAEAEQHALKDCQKRAKDAECKVIMTDDNPVAADQKKAAN